MKKWIELSILGIIYIVILSVIIKLAIFQFNGPSDEIHYARISEYLNGAIVTQVEIPSGPFKIKKPDTKYFIAKRGNETFWIAYYHDTSGWLPSYYTTYAKAPLIEYYYKVKF